MNHFPARSNPHRFGFRCLTASGPLLAFAGLLSAQPFTGTAGNGSPFTNLQPSLALQELVMAAGIYPQRNETNVLSSDGDAMFSEVRLFAGAPVLSASGCPSARGQALPIQNYQALFSLVGTIYGGDGRTTFQLPDLRGRLALALGQGPGLASYEQGEISGIETLTLFSSNLPSHSHLMGTAATAPVGNAVAIDNRQPSLALRYIINGYAELRLIACTYPPQGWLTADGQTLSTSQYPGLFNLIGTTYGGNGTTTFALPDLRGRVAVGRGQGPGLTNRVVGTKLGAENTALALGHLPAHAHSLPYGGFTGQSGGAKPLDTIQPALVVNYAVATKFGSGAIFPGYDTNPFAGSGNAPVLGEVRAFASATLHPDIVSAGFVTADGRTLAISSNQALFSILGTTYGGDGKANFAIPDLRGRAVVGTGTGPFLSEQVLGQTSGEESRVLSHAEMPVHSHSIASPVETIPNRSFEADVFGVDPGYVSGNGPITGWTASDKAGLNPAVSSPFANNGATPHGSNVAFIQSDLNEARTLSTTISGLNPGETYALTFRANMRDYLGFIPAPSLSLDGGPYAPFSVSPMVGGGNPYHRITRAFTATSNTAVLTLRNLTADDSTLLVDDFRLTRETTPWTVSPWTNDASSNIVNGKTLWAYRLGNVGNTSVNGVAVIAIGGPNPAVAGHFSLSGFDQTFSNDSNALTALGGGSGSTRIGRDFVYGANPGSLTLQGLTAGQNYTVTLYGVGYDADGARSAIISGPHHGIEVDENLYGNDRGLRLDYSFTAGELTHRIDFTPRVSGFTFHLYGLALRTANPEFDLVPPPGSGAFGNVILNTAAARSFTIANIGSEPLPVIGASVFGPNAADFVVDASVLAGSVPPAGQSVFTVSFTPSTVGPRIATLRVETGDADEPFLDIALSGTGVISFTAWQLAEFGTSASNPAIAGPLADPENDGNGNLLEYALQLNPLQSDRGLLPDLIVAGGARVFAFRYRPAAVDLCYIVERGDDLGGWDEIYRYDLSTGQITESGVTAEEDSLTETITLTDPATGPKLFWRLLVRQVP